MNKRLKALSCAIVTIFALTISPISPNVGPFSVDVVSAATGDAPVVTPPKPSTPSNPGKSNTSTSSNTSYAPTVATSFSRLLKLGSAGIDVTFLQVRLSMYGYGLNADGVYGKSTFSAVKSFQSKHNLKADGIASMATLAKLTPKVIVKTIPTSILKLGSTGGDVKLLQTRLSMFGYRLYGDGVFGNLTLTAVKNYQSKHYLTADGIVGAKTIAKLFAKAVVKPVKPPVKPVKPPVKPPVVVPPVVTPPDVVTTASLVDNTTNLGTSIGKDGNWIVTTTKNLVTDKDLVIEGVFKKAATDVDPQRKLGLYTQETKADGTKIVTNRFSLTAPKLTVKSPYTKLQGGTFMGDVYVQSRNFQLIDATIVGDVYVHSTDFTLKTNAKIIGNVYFDNLEAQRTFNKDATSTIKGTQSLLPEPVLLDSVAGASLVGTAEKFETAISPAGTWIICPIKDMVISKDIVLDGEKSNTKTPPVVGRKIGLYFHDGDNITTARFTLTAPKLTIKSTKSNISKGTFKGDLYVAATDFKLLEARVVGDVYVSATGFTLITGSTIEGNVYFATQALKDAFDASATSLPAGNTITGTQTVGTK